MVPFEYIKGFPSKSMRIQRGSLRETISNLRKLNTIWLEILRISFECISDFPKILKNLIGILRELRCLGTSPWPPNEFLVIYFQIVFNFLRLPMVPLRLPLWILIDLEGNPFIYSKETINILFDFWEKEIYFYRYEWFRKQIKPKPHV